MARLGNWLFLEWIRAILTIQQSILYSINTPPTRVSLARRPPLWGASLFRPDHENAPYVILAVQQVMVYSAHTPPTRVSLGRRPPLWGASLFLPGHENAPRVILAVQQVIVYSAHTPPTIASLGRRPPYGGRFFLPLSALPLHEFRAEENNFYLVLLQRLTVIPPVSIHRVQYLRAGFACQRDGDELAVGQVE